MADVSKDGIFVSTWEINPERVNRREKICMTQIFSQLSKVAKRKILYTVSNKKGMP